MLWQLTLEEFGPNIQRISGVDNMVDDALSRLLYTSIDKYEPRSKKAQCFANDLFEIIRAENIEYCFPP